MKSPTKFSYASGSTRRKIFEITNRCGRYSDRALARKMNRFNEFSRGLQTPVKSIVEL